MSMKKILAQRQKTHGDFSGHAEISQNLKLAISYYAIERDCKLSDTQKEALDMIAHKIARILNGDPNHRDHWDDIAGYATLVAEEL